MTGVGRKRPVAVANQTPFLMSALKTIADGQDNTQIHLEKYGGGLDIFTSYAPFAGLRIEKTSVIQRDSDNLDVYTGKPHIGYREGPLIWDTWDPRYLNWPKTDLSNLLVEMRGLAGTLDVQRS